MRKGQAALEFMSTYGWAVMVVLIAIAALTYFGVFDFEGLVPDQCLLSDGFGCQDHQLSAGSDGLLDVLFVLENQLPQSMNISAVNVTCYDCNSGVGSSQLCGVSQIIKASSSVEVSCADIGSVVTGKKVTLEISFDYTPVGKRYPKPATGKIVSEVIQK